MIENGELSRGTSFRRGVLWLHIALVGAVVAGALVGAFAPLGTTCEIPVCEAGEACGPEICTSGGTVAQEGWTPILVLYGIPFLMATMAAAIRNRGISIATAAVIGLFVVLGAASLGLTLVPALILAIVIAVVAGKTAPGSDGLRGR